MISEYRKNVLYYLGLDSGNKIRCDATEPIIWLRSTKLSFDGKYLADTGFETIDRLFTHFNRLTCPRILRNRNVKQHDVTSFLSKVECYRLRCTSQVKCSFFKIFDAVKDYVPRENMSLFMHANECGCALVNFQQPLRKAIINPGLPIDYCD